MASLPSANPHLAIHLADRALTPLISSSSATASPSASSDHDERSTPAQQLQSQSLSSLTATAITAYDTAARLQLGLPQRLMISTETGGPIILHSFLNPTSSSAAPPQLLACSRAERDIVQEAREGLRPLTATTAGSNSEEGPEEDGTLVNGSTACGERIAGTEAVEETNLSSAPLLIGTVIAPRTDEVADARRAAARLEKLGVEFQRVWVRELDDPKEFGVAGDFA
ncbi:hypothetical protein BP6252_03125 [Coleophoma cylindrospora]|uniref:Uncharacterized protein n=1 Tax=Coleophoma cylindrospora TaxID=1849047 RepID=A0A3D8S6U6_9HELO|nr:hypothetical protein BP6252_03125 [Coleophoma cylindrospora]